MRLAELRQFCESSVPILVFDGLVHFIPGGEHFLAGEFQLVIGLLGLEVAKSSKASFQTDPTNRSENQASNGLRPTFKRGEKPSLGMKSSLRLSMVLRTRRNSPSLKIPNKPAAWGSLAAQIKANSTAWAFSAAARPSSSMLKCGINAGLGGMGAQDFGTQAVDGADTGGSISLKIFCQSALTPASSFNGRAGFDEPFFDLSPDTGAHFAGGFVGEGDGDQGADRVATLQQAQVARHQGAGFARTGPGSDGDGGVALAGGLLLRAFEIELG